MTNQGQYRIRINAELKPESEAQVSVFDSGFVLGDGLWEGVRIVGGKPAFLDAHIIRDTQPPYKRGDDGFVITLPAALPLGVSIQAHEHQTMHPVQLQSAQSRWR